MFADGEAHHHDWHKHTNSIVRNTGRGLALDEKGNQDGHNKSNGNRARKGPARVAVDDYLGDFTHGHIAPLGGL